MDPGIFGREDHIKVLDGGIPHFDVVFHSIGKQHHVLIHHSHRALENRARYRGHGLAVEQDLPTPGLIQAGQQLGDGGFA